MHSCSHLCLPRSCWLDQRRPQAWARGRWGRCSSGGSLARWSPSLRCCFCWSSCRHAM